MLRSIALDSIQQSYKTMIKLIADIDTISGTWSVSVSIGIS